jgi:hypothetical protein
MNFKVRPPVTIQPSDLTSLNQLLKPLGFRLSALNNKELTVVGEGFRQEAITTIYSYFSAKRKRSQGIGEAGQPGD